MMKTRCIKARRNIAAWLNLAEPERRRLREHTQGCADCRTELEGALAVLEQLEAGKDAYSELRYTGPRPSFRDQPVLTPAGGPVPPKGDTWDTNIQSRRRFWRPLPVALAAALFAVSLAIYLLSVGQPPVPAPKATPTVTAGAEPAPKPQAGPPAIRPASAAAALEAIRRQASQLRRPSAPKRPSGLTLRLPSRPVPPKPNAGRGQD